MSVESTAPTPALPPPTKWMPADVDAALPPVESGVSCNLDESLPKVGRNAIKATRGLHRFTATEHMQSPLVNDQGMSVKHDPRTFNYMVSMTEIRPGILNV